MQLVLAYARRKRFEAKLAAVELAKIFGGGGTGGGRGKYNRISPSAMLGKLGVKL